MIVTIKGWPKNLGLKYHCPDPIGTTIYTTNTGELSFQTMNESPVELSYVDMEWFKDAEWE